MNCINCFHLKLRKKKAYKWPVVYCSMGIIKGVRNHELQVRLTEEQCSGEGYIVDCPAFEKANKCPLFDDMGDD